MKSFYSFFAFAAVAVFATAAFADIEATGTSSAGLGSDTADLLTIFNLATAAGQETSNGCTMNPMSGNQQVITELPPLPENLIQPVSFSEPIVSSSSSENEITNPPDRPYYPSPKKKEPPVTPEPGTLLMMGLGAAALVPFMWRKRGIRKNVEIVSG